ncbi:WS/DGAT domain-containing protein [Nonomuraea fuscirosea]|uniref:wax ester/triacylglycerol synthase domain-containing protein n=1 Tax=Nonomuraea fuscirosea TaxID=1291556 RepID=UPI002DDB1F2B|nr:wax ester/triacylglycerol synthase domain-containing protein [Nonomuraea fuscirosea]WSA54822.1 WS/DGAT domain-containing protein [Nonomuraea fuscirosea]
MRQLTALDAQFLNVETTTTAAHVAGLALLDSADGSVNRAALAELLLDRLHLSPALSLRLVEVPLGLDHPYWAADPDFDIANHLFERELPEPGDDWQLAETVAQLHACRLDRAHPLWEMHLITGLTGGKVAVYTKVHHAAIDGVSGAETLATLLDLTPDGRLTRRGIPPTTTPTTTKPPTGPRPTPLATAPTETEDASDGSMPSPTPTETGHAVSKSNPSSAPATANGSKPSPTPAKTEHAADRSKPSPTPAKTEHAADGSMPSPAPAETKDAGGGPMLSPTPAETEHASGGAMPGSPAPDDDTPGMIRMLAGAAVRGVTHPVRALQSAVRAAEDLDAIPVVAGLPGAKLIAKAARVVSGDGHHRPGLPSLAVPRTPFNGPISARRHLSFGSLSLKDVKNVAKANGISVNDVVMTLCTSALRSWLRERNALPEAPLIVAVPVAVRRAEAKDLVGNQISAMVAPLPTNVADARERLQAVGNAMSQAKRRFARAPATWLSELCSMLPAPVTSLATPAIFRLAGMAFPPINLIISNVPGPQFPLYLCGGRVLSYYPLSVLTDMSGGLNITCFSYDGMLDFGIVACPERVDDVWSLLAHLRTALDELLDDQVDDEFRNGAEADLVTGQPA